MTFQCVWLFFLLLRSPPISRVAQSSSEVVFKYKREVPCWRGQVKIQISLCVWTVKWEKAEGVMLQGWLGEKLQLEPDTLTGEISIFQANLE